MERGGKLQREKVRANGMLERLRGCNVAMGEGAHGAMKRHVREREAFDEGVGTRVRARAVATEIDVTLAHKRTPCKRKDFNCSASASKQGLLMQSSMRLAFYYNNRTPYR
eukprot:6188002-Pleurochrysis_carterae.AAC.1